MAAYHRYLSLTGAVIALFAAGCAHPGGSLRKPADPLTLGIEFYRGPLDHLRAVRSGSCPMHPGCSSYARASIEKHGPFLGWAMACDRLMRCGRDELARTRPALIDGQRRHPDPLVRNDWWWHDPARPNPLGPGRDWKVLVD
jgi:putative component of membrane protein insertase Oxa1/YidC/SpoIIIJ protein YidD